MVITKNSIGDTARTVFAFQAGLADTLLASASFPQYLATDVRISHVVTAQQLRAACSPRLSRSLRRRTPGPPESRRLGACVGKPNSG